MKRQEALQLLQEMDLREVRDVFLEYASVTGNRVDVQLGEEYNPPLYSVSMSRCSRDLSDVLSELHRDFPEVRPVDLMQRLKAMTPESQFVLESQALWPEALQLASRYRRIGCTVNITLLPVKS